MIGLTQLKLFLNQSRNEDTRTNWVSTGKTIDTRIHGEIWLKSADLKFSAHQLGREKESAICFAKLSNDEERDSNQVLPNSSSCKKRN
jgi:hypothetical protein